MAPATENITDAYSQALVGVGRLFPDVVVLDADIADSCRTEAFGKVFPERTFDLGVAEQSLPTIAAGLALCGKIPFYNSFAVFSVTRGVDMIRQSIAYNRANVKIVGHAAGQSMGYTGPSHHTIADISILRALPHLTILNPCDAIQTRKMVLWMAETTGPVYLRLTRSDVPNIHNSSYLFEAGKTVCLREGQDVTVFASGDVVHLALAAAVRLEEEKIHARVVDVPTIKPLNAGEIVRHGSRTRAAITIEDHSIYGGLGSAVAEIYAERLQKCVYRIGIPDVFTESDTGQALRSAYGISVDAIVERTRKALDRKR